MKHYIIEGVVFNEGVLQKMGDWWNSDTMKNVRGNVKNAIIKAKDVFINDFLPFAFDWLENNKDVLMAASSNVDWKDRTKRKQQMALIGAGLTSLYMDYKKFNAKDRAELDRWVQLNTMANDLRDLYNRTRKANQTQIPHLQTRNLGEAGEMFINEYNNKIFFFLNEEVKLTHLTHLEDMIFDTDTNKIISYVENIVKDLSGNSSSAKFQAKIDGSPAIIAGTNPENGQFFVATKSLFNKTPKINYTEEDVDNNHSGELADKLKYALQYLPAIFPKGLILQGDFLYGGTNKGISIKKIDGQSYLTFTPNSLTYAVPANSELADIVNQSKLAIAWHTTYTGSTIKDLNASFHIDTSQLKKSKDVWFFDTNVTDISSALLNDKEKTDIRKSLDDVKKFASIKIPKNIYDLLNMFVNDEFRNMNTSTMTVQKFILFIQKRYEKAIADAKMQKTKDAKQKEFDDIVNTINKLKLDKLFEAHNLLYQIKNIILKKLNSIKRRFNVFIDTPDGFKVANDEGFVYIGDSDTGVVKLVDRIGFSLYNFQNSQNRKGAGRK